MMKKILFFILLIFFIFNIPIVNRNVNATPTALTWCTGGDIHWNNNKDCKIQCSDLNVGTNYGGNYTLSSGYASGCEGQASKFQINIRKIELGTPAGWNGYRCTVLTDSNSVIVDLVSKKSGETYASLKTDFKKCNTVIYDRIYVTIDRIITIAGHTNYPDGSGKIARTTSPCTTDSLSQTSGAALANLSWLDTISNYGNANTAAWGNTSLCYGRPSINWSSSFLKVNSNGFSTTDYKNSSDQSIQVDALKDEFMGTLNSAGNDGFGNTTYTSASTSIYLPNDPTFYGQTNDAVNGLKIDPLNSTRYIYTFLNGSADLGGNAVNQKLQKNKNQTIDISLYSAATTKEYGIRFLFMNKGGTAALVGFTAGNPGIVIEYNQK
jgi:hypothetical protein